MSDSSDCWDIWQENAMSVPDKTFRDACRSGEVRNLARLIAERKFEVNKPLGYALQFGRLPIIVAIEKTSLPVLILLLKHGADPNAQNGRPLEASIYRKNLSFFHILLSHGANPGLSYGRLLPLAMRSFNDVNVVRLMLDLGADITANDFSAIHLAITLGRSNPGSVDSQILELILERAIQLGDNPDAEEKLVNLSKYSRLVKAIVQDDLSEITRLLEASVMANDYTTYHGFFDGSDGGDPYKKYRPTRFIYDKRDVIKIFVRMGVDLPYIFEEAVGKSDYEMMNLCTLSPNFDPHARNENKATVLHKACMYISHSDIKMVKLLVERFNLDVNVRDSKGCTPLFWITNTEIMSYLLTKYPETDVNVVNNDGITLLSENSYKCELYALLLEHGADPELRERLGRDNLHDRRCRKDNGNCEVCNYLRKFIFIDQKYVKGICPKILSMNIKEFRKLDNPLKHIYKAEIAKMDILQLSRSTESLPGKTLYDFIFSDANEAANYSRNKIIQGIYAEFGQDFKNFLPHYGFALNFCLKRGTVRYERLESALEFLCSAIGAQLPHDFAKLIFGFFSNKTLNCFAHGTTRN